MNRSPKLDKLNPIILAVHHLVSAFRFCINVAGEVSPV